MYNCLALTISSEALSLQDMIQSMEITLSLSAGPPVFMMVSWLLREVETFAELKRPGIYPGLLCEVGTGWRQIGFHGDVEEYSYTTVCL